MSNVAFKKSLWKFRYFFVVLFFCVFFGTYLGSWMYSFEHRAEFFSNPIETTIRLLENRAIRNINHSNGYITALIMGIDSRELRFDGEEFTGKDIHTDTIIQLVYDYNANNLFMISIPRDTGIAIDESCTTQEYDKAINRLYAAGQNGMCENGGVGLMMKYTEEVTGFENHYFALVSFETFYDFFEVIGENRDGENGLWIDIPENVYEYYPVGDHFEYFELQKGYQFLSSEELLRYARSRKSTSDFVRARRQQIVIEAVKDQIISEGLSDPAKIFEIYNSFRDNALYSEITLDEIVAGVSFLDNVANANVYNLVLDDTIGGQNAYMVKPSFSPPYGKHTRPGFYLTPVAYADDCCKEDDFFKVKQYLESIFSYPSVYFEEADVALYTSSGTQEELPLAVEEWLELDPPLNSLTISEIAFTPDFEEEIIVVVFGDGSYPVTIEYLEDKLNAQVKEVDETKLTPRNGEDIGIFIQ
ncbi:LCP family protein [Candidatus Dojkabacteria bacterium]|uniref:LCP family protein n=1 Tax=Candidatus Dojkabacteria bacterium TaxID=2099670 RepID=A0A955RK72_9BACT|nr:LCP family protein [Candidatus Dojkabacteria bacterium]